MISSNCAVVATYCAHKCYGARGHIPKLASRHDPNPSGNLLWELTYQLFHSGFIYFLKGTLKFMFSKKASKIVKIFTYNLTATAHCSFSSNSFHGQKLKKLSTKQVTQKTKNVALEKFLEQTTLKPCDF